MENQKADKWPSILLVVGFSLVSFLGAYCIVFRFAGGWRLPPIVIPLIIAGFLAILLGEERVGKGSQQTRQLYSLCSQFLCRGALAGSVTACGVYLVLESAGLNLSWLFAYLVLSIVWGLLFGIPFGGLGGVMLGSIWKHRFAAWVGGGLAAMIFAAIWISSNFG